MTLKLVRKQFLNISTPAFILIASFTIPLYAAMEDGSPVTGTSTKVIQFDTEGATFATSTSTSTIDGLVQEAAHKAQVKEESPVLQALIQDIHFSVQKAGTYTGYRACLMSVWKI